MDDVYKKRALFVSQFKEAIKKIAKQYYTDRIKKDPDLIDDYLFPNEKEEFQKWCAKTTNQRYKYVMFTVNFKEEASLDQIMKKIEKCIAKTWIIKYYLSLEQRGLTAEEAGKGKHMHMKVWLEDGKNPYECKREVYNTFKHLVGNKLHVNARYSNRDDCFEEYIQGYKKGKMKPTFYFDKYWREKNRLLTIYTSANEEPPTCKAPKIAPDLPPELNEK